MTAADEYRRVVKVFDEVCDLPLHQQAPEVERLCDGDSGLRIAVMRMLDQDRRRAGSEISRGGGMHVIAADLAADGEVAPARDRVDPLPERIGRYRVIRRLGSGGMGVVYLAEQDFPRRTVAVKVMLPGATSPESVQRFMHETHVLARLRHPGIAQILEAGMADGGDGSQPYFAMEYIEGPPLLTYAGDNNLDTRRRVELIIQICEAVHHAHLRGIIHRDLKPANILVETTEQQSPDTTALEPQARTKVLDFGIARSTDADVQMTVAATGMGILLGTLPYMSPEQIAGDPVAVDVRCDVYAIGVILYELLADRSPHDLRQVALPEAIRTIAEREPPRLSMANRTFRGDLSTIVAKAMARDPARRYASAAELGYDLRRYLESRPIVARPPTALYQISRFARRHRLAVAGAMLVFLSMLGSTIFSAVYAYRASAARNDAHRAEVQEKSMRIAADANARAAMSAEAAARRQTYFARIAAAESAIQAGDFPSARKHLEAVAPSNRDNWEWLHYYGTLDDSIGVLDHSLGALTVALSPDGSRAAGGGRNGKLYIWDTGQRTLDAVIEGHEGELHSVTFSADGSMIATGSGDSTARVWDAESGSLISIFAGHSGPVFSVSFSHDGAMLVTASMDGTARVWDVASHSVRAVLQGHTASVMTAEFGPDDSIIASASQDRTVRLWDVSTYSEIATLSGHAAHVLSLAFSHDGSRMATAGNDRSIRIWRLEDRSTEYVMQGHRDTISRIVFSPDDHSVLSISSDSTLRLWNVETGEQERELHGHLGRVVDVAWSADVIASASLSEPIHIWDTALITDPSRLYGHDLAISQIIFSPDGSLIASASGDGTIRIWDRVRRQTVQVLRGHEDWVHAIAFLPDGKRLASASYDTTVRVWNLDTGDAELILRGHADRVLAVTTLGSDGLIASASVDGTIRVWDSSSGETNAVLAEEETRSLKCLAASPDGRTVAAGGAGGLITLWDIEQRAIRTTLAGHTALIQGLAFSPDGRRLASVCDDMTLRIWDVATGDLMFPPVVHSDGVMSVAFIDRGRRLATGDTEGTIRLWDPQDGGEVAVLRGHSYPVLTIVSSPDGTLVASGSLDKVIRLWDA